MRVVEILAIEQSRSWGTCSVRPIWNPCHYNADDFVVERVQKVHGLEA